MTARRRAENGDPARWQRRFVVLFAAIGLLTAGAALAVRRTALHVWNLERQSIRALQAAHARTGADAWTALVLGRKLAGEERRREAVETFGDGLRRLQTRDDPQLRALLDGELALNLVLLGESALARPYFQKALELDPGNVPAHMALGWMLSSQGRHDVAVKQFEIVTQLEPDHAEAWHALGRAQLAARKRPEAEAAFRRAVELEPKEARFHLGLGDALAIQSRFEDAERSFRQATTLDPGNREARAALARSRTLRARTPEEYRKARAELEPLVQESTDAVFLAHLGVLDSQFGDLPNAEKYLKRAIALDPTNPETAYALAMVYRRQKREREAKATLARFERLERNYRRVVQLRKRLPGDPKNLSMNLELARLLEERAEWGEAARQYRYIVHTFPEQTAARRRLAELERNYPEAAAPPAASAPMPAGMTP